MLAFAQTSTTLLEKEVGVTIVGWGTSWLWLRNMSLDHLPTTFHNMIDRASWRFGRYPGLICNLCQQVPCCNPGLEHY